MRHTLRIPFLLLALAVLPAAQARGQDFVVEPVHNAVDLVQYDFIFANSTQIDSSTGLIRVDIPQLRLVSGLPEGFLNVHTGQGWVVQNLPVFPSYPYDTISTSFEIAPAQGIDVQDLDAFILFSLGPQLNFAPQPPFNFVVDPEAFAAEGRNQMFLGPPLLPPPPAAVTFVAAGQMEFWFQPGHPNQQTAHNQCGPMAVANSMAWLSQTYEVPMPFPHDPGLGILFPDGTLVGELDFWMGRTGASRQNGNVTTDTGFLSGKLDFIDFYGLPFFVEHQSIAGPGLIGGGNFTSGSSTSTGHGVPTATWIIDNVKAGDDVEVGYANADGSGHWVEVTGGGYIMGIPFITFVSDHVQSDQDAKDGKDNDEGTNNVDFAFLVDIDNDGTLNMVGVPGNPELEVAVSEEPILGPWLWTSNMVSGLVGQITITDAVPDSDVGIAYSLTGTGPTLVPAGPCGNQLVDLSAPIQILPLIPADPNGTASLQLPIPPGLSGLDVHLQGLVLQSCELTNGKTVTLE